MNRKNKWINLSWYPSPTILWVVLTALTKTSTITEWESGQKVVVACFAFTVDESLHNAWQLYRKDDNNSPLDYLRFSRRIAHFYLQKYGTPPAIPKRVLPGIRFDSANQFLLPAEKQSTCALCKKNSRKMCKKCRVNLRELCFEESHKMEHQ